MSAPEWAELEIEGNSIRAAEVTPAWCVEAIWPHVRPVAGPVLDPCGDLVEVLTRLHDPRVVYAVTGDVRRAAELRYLERAPRHVHCGDWLAGGAPQFGWPRLVIARPPFERAREYVVQAAGVAGPVGGEACLLLPLVWLGSRSRGEWLRDHLPAVYVLSERLDGRTHAWMVWGPTRRAMLHVLPAAPYGRPGRAPRRRRERDRRDGRQLTIYDAMGTREPR